jgi:hypothetical protein
VLSHRKPPADLARREARVPAEAVREEAEAMEAVIGRHGRERHGQSPVVKYLSEQ